MGVALLLLTLVSRAPTQDMSLSPAAAITIVVENLQGLRMSHASVQLRGPIETGALTDDVGRVELRLPPGRYWLDIRGPDGAAIQQSLTVITGLPYELHCLLPNELPSLEERPVTHRLGPVAVGEVKLRDDGTISYMATNSDRLLTYQLIEITRVFADGSSHTARQEHDKVQQEALTTLRMGTFGFRSVWIHRGSGEQVQLARDADRRERPVAARLRVAAVAGLDIPAEGDGEALRMLRRRRLVMVAELDYLIEILIQARTQWRGVTLGDMLLEQLASARDGESTSEYRLAMRSGLEALMSRREDEFAEQAVKNVLKSSIQFRDIATDEMRLLAGH
jgi:hypothetical protein